MPELLLGSKDGKVVMHTVAWLKICRPKELGGFVVPNLKHTNLALLAKLTWSIIYQTNSLISQVFWAKYGGCNTLVRNVKSANCSNVWRSI